MSPELEYFVDNFIIQELKTPIRESFDNYQKLSIDNYENSFMAILMNEGNIERTQLVPEFNSEVLRLNKEILMNHGIVVVDEVDIDFTSKMIHAVLSIDEFVDPLLLLNELEHPDEPEEKLSEVLSHLMEHSITNILLHISSIEPALITRIREILESKISNSHVDVELQRNIYTKLKSIRKFLGIDNLLAFNLVHDGLVVGLEFSAYTKYASRHFDDVEVTLASKEIFALLALSSDGYANPLITYRNNSANIFVELDHITKIDTLINKLVGEYTKFTLQPPIVTMEETNG